MSRNGLKEDIKQGFGVIAGLILGWVGSVLVVALVLGAICLVIAFPVAIFLVGAGFWMWVQYKIKLKEKKESEERNK